MDEYDIISLLSDDESPLVLEPPRKKKRIKPTNVTKVLPKIKPITIINLSDDDDDKNISKDNNICTANAENEEEATEKSENEPLAPTNVENGLQITKVESLANGTIDNESEESQDFLKTDFAAVDVPSTAPEVCHSSSNGHNGNEAGSSTVTKLDANYDYTLSCDFSNFCNKCVKLLQHSEVKNLHQRENGRVERLFYSLLDKGLLNNFHDILKNELEGLKDSKSAWVGFTRIFVYLKNLFKENVDVKLLNKVNELEKLSRKFIHRIRKLETAEIDINDDDDENNAYMQVDKYKSKFRKIEDKLCSLYSIEPNSKHFLFMPLSFDDSCYPIINRAINVKYNKTLEMPDYCQFAKYVRKYLKSKSSFVPEIKLDVELKFCFTKLGKLMSERRKKDLRETHTSFFDEETEIPASDEELSKQLDVNKKTGESKMDNILNIYSVMQDQGRTVELSEDSDDSHAAESNDENDL